ncbi:hypothetical protein EVAR_3050_1 [Eumeta japonica]|uniref:Uncharacterized protein n=1 Tax=Eumeta variegata TaxID=151549 RepID=A0A4C1STJ9_EUMVA|nr:hypothetical protein EVAR_3050_1 [Eumeta japonica]
MAKSMSVWKNTEIVVSFEVVIEIGVRLVFGRARSRVASQTVTAPDATPQPRGRKGPARKEYYANGAGDATVTFYDFSTHLVLGFQESILIIFNVTSLSLFLSVHVCVRVSVLRACVRVCVCLCGCACGRAPACTCMRVIHACLHGSGVAPPNVHVMRVVGNVMRCERVNLAGPLPRTAVA